MTYRSRAVPEDIAYGGEPQYIQTSHGLVKNDAAYKEYLQEKQVADNNPNLGMFHEQIQPSISQEIYMTESAWGYPNNMWSPFYNKAGRPYDLKPAPYTLGTLSGLYESHKGQNLWNNGNLDKTGGWSYGTYQIAAKNGTMKDYLRYLQKHPNYQKFYHRLQQAGGINSALKGELQFKNTWADLSKNNDFLLSQQDFIIDKKLNPTLKYISDIKGINLDNRSPVIRDVLYSTATQHGEGGASHVMHRRFGRNTDVSALSDAELIHQIYNERSDVDHYFKNSSKNIKDNLKKRFQKEKNKALELLKQYP